jgi:hypothetical protein
MPQRKLMTMEDLHRFDESVSALAKEYATAARNALIDPVDGFEHDPELRLSGRSHNLDHRPQLSSPFLGWRWFVCSACIFVAIPFFGLLLRLLRLELKKSQPVQ